MAASFLGRGRSCTSVAGRVLVDTNVFVYDLDADEPDKQFRARSVLELLFARAQGAVSTQILAEILAVSTRRFRRRCEPDTAAAQVRRLGGSWTVLPVTSQTVLHAVRAVERHGLAYYDAQVWAAARLARIPYVLTEDFSDGLEIEGVTFVDPFRPGFDIDALIT